MKNYLLGICMMLTFGAGMLFADEIVEPEIAATSTSYSYGEIDNLDPNSGCWEEVINRHSVDSYTNLYLYVDIDGCLISEYETYNILQGSTPEPVQMNVDDILIIWDEDATHGEVPPDGDYNFTGTLVADPNCPYVRVRTNDQNEILNWSIHRVVTAGTLTSVQTGYNEHDVILLPSGYDQLLFDKEDDVAGGECVSPEDTVVYEICFENVKDVTFEDCYIVDWLPEGMTYPYGVDTVDSNLNVIPADPNYDPEKHNYTWYIGDIGPNDSGCVQLEVVVNEGAEPGFDQINIAELYVGNPSDPNSANYSIIAVDIERTPICCWDNSGIIYVDKYATGYDTGVSWENAYNTEYGLKKALKRAWDSPCDGPFKIYVAQGIYYPGSGVDDSFELPPYTEVYGGFPTGGCGFADRNPKKYMSALNGLLDDIGYVYKTVDMREETLLNGVTVANGFDYNVYGDSGDFTVKQCVITNSWHYGIYAEYGNVTVKLCLIKNNGADGIYHEGILNYLDVTNSWVMRNEYFGIQCYNTTPTIKNSIISESDLAKEGRAGISINNPAYSPVLHNLTISNNKSLAIEFTDSGNAGSDPNDTSLDYPDVDNCIIYFNNDNSKQQVAGFDPNTHIAYSCVQKCVEVNNNIKSNPEFAYKVDPLGAPDPTNYHLGYNSACIDTGNPNIIYDNQMDYDNETRVYGNEVDRGADEVYTCDGDYSEDDFYNAFDYDSDGIINLVEFQPIADGWLSLDPNDPGWNLDPNYADPNDILSWNKLGNYDDTGDSQYSIDMADLELFCENWLWKACWYDNLNSVETAETAASTQSVTLLSTDSGVASLARTASNLMLAEDIIEKEYNLYDTLSNPELTQVVKDFRYLQDNVLEMLEECPTESEDEENLLDLLDFFDEELVKIKESLQ